MSKHRPPWRSGLYAGLICLVAGTVISLALVMFIGSDDYHESGREVGQGLGQLSVIVGVAGFLGARHRAKKRMLAEKDNADVFR